MNINNSIKVANKGFLLALLAGLIAFCALPAMASANTKVTGTAKWTGKKVGKSKLRGKISIANSSSYNGSVGSINFTGSLKSGQVKIKSLQLRDLSISGKVGKKRAAFGRIASATGELFSYKVDSPVKLTAAGAKALKRAGLKGAKKGKSVATLKVNGQSVHKIKSGNATMTFNATLTNQFQYLTSEATGSFAPFAPLDAALPLDGNAVFQTVYASELSGDPAYLDGRISTPLVLNPNCVVAAAGSSANALPNEAGAACAPASGTANSEGVFPVAEGAAQPGTLVGGKTVKDFMHEGGLGLQLRLGSNVLPAGGPDYGSLSVAAGNGIGGGVLLEPEIDTNSSSDGLTLTTSLGRLEIANLPGYSNSLSCDTTPDMNGNYACNSSAETQLTPLAASALSTSFGASIPSGTNLGVLETEFVIGN